MYCLILCIEDNKKKTINSNEMAYLYMLMIKQYFLNFVLLNTLNMQTTRRFKKGGQFFVRYFKMYP